MTNPDQQHTAQEMQDEVLSREPESPEEELARISESLGPFRPPTDFDLGEEFLVQPPRPIPSNLLKGTYRRRWALITRIYVALGGLCIVLGHTDTVQSLGFYVLVLGYLRYIGWGLLAIAGLRIIIGYARPGPYRFVRDGVATIGRVLAVRKRYLHGDDDGLKQFRFSVATEFRPPSKTEVCRATLESERIVPLGSPDKYTTTLRPGDYVTVVGMPTRFEQSARIYGFLGVNPNNEYVLRNGAATLSSPATSLLLALAGVIVLMFVAPVFLFGMDKYAVTGGGTFPGSSEQCLGQFLAAPR